MINPALKTPLNIYFILLLLNSFYFFNYLILYLSILRDSIEDKVNSSDEGEKKKQ